MITWTNMNLAKATTRMVIGIFLCFKTRISSGAWHVVPAGPQIPVPHAESPITLEFRNVSSNLVCTWYIYIYLNLHTCIYLYNIIYIYIFKFTYMYIFVIIYIYIIANRYMYKFDPWIKTKHFWSITRSRWNLGSCPMKHGGIVYLNSTPF